MLQQPLARKPHSAGHVTGGIAAYKSADLVRRLREAGAEVQVAMTPAATAFVGPLTFQAVSGQSSANRVAGFLTPRRAWGISNWRAGRDLILIAPATADFLARLAHGMANDLLSTLCLATDQPVAVAPAMNRLMWQNPATQDNYRLLARRGVTPLGAGRRRASLRRDRGRADAGAGGAAEPGRGFARGQGATGQNGCAEHATSTVAEVLLAPHDLQGLTVLLTAGPTREALDPVRFISNRSTGRMGFAVAEAAAQAGARVVRRERPGEFNRLRPVSSGSTWTARLEMHEAVMQRVQQADIFIATAAVADYRAAHPAEPENQENRRGPDAGTGA
jgi:phosphopantothenoylcysteine decarboxylase/phosphopantothenate--cysteine ligase